MLVIESLAQNSLNLYFLWYHPDPNMSEDFIGDASEGMFQFEKVMK